MDEGIKGLTIELPTREGIKVHMAAQKVRASLAKEGIGKNKRAEMGKAGSYAFRGIDDVYNVLSPFLAEAGLNIFPHAIKYSREERVKKSTYNGQTNESVIFTIIAEVDYKFVSSEDGSSYIVPSVGEAMDSGDKGTNKAMSAAYKNMAIQAFSIPVQGTPDSEDETHTDIKPITKAQPQPKPHTVSKTDIDLPAKPKEPTPPLAPSQLPAKPKKKVDVILSDGEITQHESYKDAVEAISVHFSELEAGPNRLDVLEKNNHIKLALYALDAKDGGTKGGDLWAELVAMADKGV